ncbi:MAG: NADH-quinone oxidoreductase subunit F, partial [Bacteroidota bacterium]|nr:NADH-quinone oxidoreductase subunit F [Bacteroidota bacterium]
MAIQDGELKVKLRAFLNNATAIEQNTDPDLLNLILRERVERPVIYLGTSTCGMVAGAGRTLQAINNYLSEKEIEAEVVEVGCIGLCSVEPVMDVQLPGRARISFQRVTADKVDYILDGILNNELPVEDVSYQFHQSKSEPWHKVPFINQIPFFASQNRIVLKNCGVINPADISEYIAGGGYRAFVKTIRNYTSEKVCTLVEESGLRGRGGGGYPTGLKWKTTLMTEDDDKFMICNADESDPGAFMDRSVIEGDPHRVIEGIAIAAYAIGADKAYIYIRAEYDLALKRMKTALQQAYEYGLLGNNVMDSGVNVFISIRQGAGAFVCGEETALIASLEGRRGMPRNKPPFPAEHGLFEKPTVVNNVETLANIPA